MSTGIQRKVETTSRNEILRNTFLIGIGSACNLIAGLIRAKAVALLLGPGGVGLFGAYGAILNLMTIVGSFGISSSGVRQMALSATTGKPENVAQTARSIQIAGIIFGFFGAIISFSLSPIISIITFGTKENSRPIAILGVAVLVSSMVASKLAVIQGLRETKIAAKANVVGTIFGLLFALPVIWLFREVGIVFVLISVPAGMILSVTWFTPNFNRTSLPISFNQLKVAISGLVQHGLPFTISTLLSACVNWFVITIIVKNQGFEMAGHFTAASTLSGVYVGFILGAMSSDLFARLTSHANDLREINEAVNQQTQVSIALALPGLTLTIVFAAEIIKMLYSESFDPASTVVQWQLIGALGKILSHPMAFIQLARGRMRVFLLTEIVYSIFYITFIYWGASTDGIRGLGFAYAGSYASYTLAMLIITKKETGFQWSAENRKLLMLSIPIILLALLSRAIENQRLALIYKTLIIIISIWISFKAICKNELHGKKLLQIVLLTFKRVRQ